jgi:resuscitation-promoting factor RpfA
MRHAQNLVRHRKRSTASRLTAISAVGAGAIAASILAPAVAAHAADGTQWDRVAHCESRDQWHINTGNGYYGGLQFGASTWSSFDTDHYASRADLASRAQQIVVANRVLGSQGWNAWPVCSKYAGAPSPTDTKTHKPVVHHGRKLAHAKWIHYTVKSGDTLARIAERHDVNGGWKAIYHANRKVIGANPSAISTGMKLKVHARTVG